MVQARRRAGEIRVQRFVQRVHRTRSGSPAPVRQSRAPSERRRAGPHELVAAPPRRHIGLPPHRGRREKSMTTRCTPRGCDARPCDGAICRSSRRRFSARQVDGVERGAKIHPRSRARSGRARAGRRPRHHEQRVALGAQWLTGRAHGDALSGTARGVVATAGAPSTGERGLARPRVSARRELPEGLSDRWPRRGARGRSGAASGLPPPGDSGEGRGRRVAPVQVFEHQHEGGVGVARDLSPSRAACLSRGPEGLALQRVTVASVEEPRICTSPWARVDAGAGEPRPAPGRAGRGRTPEKARRPVRFDAYPEHPHAGIAATPRRHRRPRVAMPPPRRNATASAAPARRATSAAIDGASGRRMPRALDRKGE